MAVDNLADLLGRHRSFEGPAYLHAPMDAGDPLDFSALEDEENRWNRRRQPTLYLACDPAVALAEFARHCVPLGGADRVRRRLYRFELRVDGLIDLVTRSGPRIDRLPLDPIRWLHREEARRVADLCRRDASVAGLIVPSVAFLDDPARFNLAIFVNRLPADRSWLRSLDEVGALEVTTRS